jgi:iron complex transport system permease protein
VLLSPRTRTVRVGLLALILVAAVLLHVGIGSFLWISPFDVLREIARGKIPGSDTLNNVVWSLRLPRALGCVIVGGLLGTVGAAFQALFRNPLAEPYVIGVSSGAAVGGTLALLLGISEALFGFGGLAIAFVGGIGSLGLVMALARRRGSISVPTLLLAGVVVGSLLSSVLTLLLLMAGQDTNQVLRWLLGSMGSMFWDRLGLMTLILVVGGFALLMVSRQLNAFSVSESQAQQLGVDPAKLKRTVLVWGTVMASAAVGTAGIIGFLGLVAPHIARRLVGVDLRYALLGSLLTGSTILLLADLAAQRILPGTELPVGSITAILGAPTLLILLRKERG